MSNVNNVNGAIVIDSSLEKNEMLKKKWESVHKTASAVSNVAKTGLIASLLSPFDFDGPIIEIISASVVALSFLAKKVSENRLKKLDDVDYDFLSEADREDLIYAANMASSARKGRR